jgi:hypothetical protein
VYVFSGIKKNRWKLKRMNIVEKWAHKVGGNIDVYVTIQQYAVQTMEYGLIDEPYYAPIWFDFDHATDANEAKKDALKLCETLTNIINLDQNSLRIWFSGKKGFHVTIDARVCGIMPHNRLHLLYKNIAIYYKDLLNLETLDMNVYSIRRQWRIPNSKRSNKIKINGKSVDQYKIELSLTELSILSIDEIRELAVSPREPLASDNVSLTHTDDGRKWVKKFVDEFKSEEYLRENQRKSNTVSSKDFSGKYPVCINALLNYNFAKERRHQVSLTLATFFKTIELEQSLAERKMEEWVEGIPWDTNKNVERLRNAKSHIRSVYGGDTRDYFFSCKYTRGNKGSHYTGKDVVIPCEYKKCSFIIGEEEEETEKEIGLFDCLRPENHMSECTAFGKIVSFTDKLYIVPIRIVTSCPFVPNDNETHSDNCDGCGMPVLADNVTDEIDQLKRTVVLGERNLLSLINVTDKQKSEIIRALSAINTKCRKWRFKETETGTLRKLYMRSTIDVNPTGALCISLEQDKKADLKMQPAFIVNKYGTDFFVNRSLDVRVKCVPVSDPKDQSIHLGVKEVTDGFSDLEKFAVTEQLFEQLKSFQPDSGQSVDEKIAERIDYISNNITFIKKRPEMNLAYDLVFHSPLYLQISGEETVDRGWLQLLVIGDPGQGKSLVGKRMMKHYGLGRYVDAATTRRTGLIYSINIDKTYKLLEWGVLPQEDRRIVMIDEFHRFNQDEIDNMTGMRSDGRVEVNAVVSGSTWARTRVIFVANPRDAVNLSSYGHGAKSIVGIFPHQQDVRRLDMALLCRSNEVELKYINVINTFNPSNIYSSSACRNLILWVWTRKYAQIRWTEGAVKSLMRHSTEISDFFCCDISITESADMRYRLGRIAQSIAAIVFSTDDKGENLWVKEEHVVYAANYFHKLMTSVGDMGLDFYAINWQKKVIMTDGEKDELQKRLADQPFFNEFLDKLLCITHFNPGTLRQLFGYDSEVFREIWTFLQRTNMVELDNRTSRFLFTPKFKKWMKDRSRKTDISGRELNLTFIEKLPE